MTSGLICIDWLILKSLYTCNSIGNECEILKISFGTQFFNLKNDIYFISYRKFLCLLLAVIELGNKEGNWFML